MAKILTDLAHKGESVSEIVGMARGMRKHAVKMPIKMKPLHSAALLKEFHLEEKKERQIRKAFTKYGEFPQILIVTEKLLTGFDAPCNAVLYLARKLKDHTLLQAIARVNRLHEQKKFGLLIDYRGILAELDSALTEYQNLADQTQGGAIYEIQLSEEHSLRVLDGAVAVFDAVAGVQPVGIRKNKEQWDQGEIYILVKEPLV